MVCMVLFQSENEPDVKVAAANALETAQKLALEKVQGVRRLQEVAL